MAKTILSTRTAFTGGWLKVYEYQVQDSRDASVHNYEVMHRGDSVAAVVYHPGKKVYLFVEQFRMGPRKNLLELVAGAVEKDEDPAQSIIREIEEETGYSVHPGSFKKLTSFYPTPGACSEYMHLYYAEAGERIHKGGGIEDEDIRLIELSPEECMDINNFEDAKTIIGMLLCLKNPLTRPKIGLHNLFKG